MKFIFWQNIISIHQSAFIKALAENHEVTLVAEEKLDKQRVSESWNIPEMGNAKVVISPSDTEIESLLADENVNNVFSGIDAFPMVYSAFKRAVALNRNITVMAEPYDWTGIKGTLRRFKYIILFVKYKKYIKHLFTTGHHGIRCFKAAGMPLAKLHQWGYFTESCQDCGLLEQSISSRPKIIYVGRFDSNKNILPILKKISLFEDNIDVFTLVGSGPLDEDVKAIAAKNKKINLVGRVDNECVKALMASHDYLILPSLYDGWGAVVNEALSCGTRVLCSNSCGAAILLDGKNRGEAFAQNDVIETINYWCNIGPVSNEQRQDIKDWANCHISGEVAANYFIETLSSKFPTAPWLIE